MKNSGQTIPSTNQSHSAPPAAFTPPPTSPQNLPPTPPANQSEAQVYTPTINWWGPGILCGIGVLLIVMLVVAAPNPRASAWEIALVASLVGGFFLIPGAANWWHMTRARIAVDANGICWRDWGRPVCVGWSDVTDYYETLKRESKTVSVVVTSAGSLVIDTFVEDARQRETLRQFIQAHATHARASMWELRGARRTDEWPQVFDYDTKHNHRTPYLPLIAAALMVLPFAVKAIPNWSNVLETLRLMGPAMTLLLFATLGGVMLAYAVMVWAVLPPRAELLKRSQQRITVDLDGILYEDGRIRIQSPWTDVKEYFVALAQDRVQSSTTFSVVTKQGQFDFRHFINGAAKLKAIIKTFSVNATTTDWKRRGDVDSGMLGGDKARWSGGAPGQGQRMYNYRTRMNRALLWFPTVASSLPLVAMNLATVMDTPLLGRDSAGPMFYVLIGLAAMWGWLCYYTTQVRTDDIGIWQRNWRGEQFIPWDEVRAYRTKSIDCLLSISIESRDTTMIVSAFIGDLEELMSEIARRAVNARDRGWEAK